MYLGGLGDDHTELSKHLDSRHEVGRVLAAGTVECVELRAAAVIGSGSASFEMAPTSGGRLRVIADVTRPDIVQRIVERTRRRRDPAALLDGRQDGVGPGLLELCELQGRRTDRGWQAACEATFDLTSNKLRPDGWTSSDAAGLPIFPANRCGTLRREFMI